MDIFPYLLKSYDKPFSKRVESAFYLKIQVQGEIMAEAAWWQASCYPSCT